MKKLIALLIGILVYTQSQAYDTIERDSIGIERVGNRTFIVHQVDQGETLFAISRRYQTAINDILQNNEQLQSGLKIGQRIRIPYISPTAVPEDSKLHRVSPGETLFSISQQYAVSVNDIMSWNNLKGNDLSVGQALILKGIVEAKPEPEPVKASPEPAAVPAQAKNEVKSTEEKPVVKKAEAKAKEEVKAATPAPTAPTTAPASSSSSETAAKALPGDWISHTVAQGETLFSIAQAYDAKVDDLITWNSLASNNLSVGQRLKVGREPSSNVPVVTATVPIIVNNERSEGQLTAPKPEVGGQNASTAYKNIKETGMAEVIEGTGNHKKYLVLHRTAPVGTIMRVRNEENDITIFARVVGKLPDTGNNSRLVIKLSKAAYDQLRAVNARFPVEVSY
ncbi:LysM peptidoglycan-binding domain-containing protein [Cecembia sp.]|uniref:LysM peptidoglycan-binding domain-containing protein n=1 Tax=Cecembia sp. TaxID=1898110 RepID=UPI0025BBF957|nr:LysM peptidoglycan-binding domain-containing protein [Cecembia sp.]